MATSDKKLVRSKSGLKIVSLTDETRSPLTIPEPPWVPDNQCAECMKCKKTFGMFNRRHHCRRCGLCYCSSCCNKDLFLPRMCFVDPVRHCTDCATITKTEEDFFEKHVKILRTGAQFNISGSGNSNPFDNNGNVYSCKLSNDQRQLQFGCNNNKHSIDPLDLNDIQSIQPMNPITDRQGNSVATGVKISFLDSCGETQQIDMKASDSSNSRLTALQWIAAVQRAMKYVYEGRGTRQLTCNTDK